MAGRGTGFLTGANAKIKLGGRTLAYATDVTYNVTVATIPVESMGKYEVHSNEPVAYSVDGSFNVIRYTKHAAAEKVTNAAASGNAPQNWPADTTDATSQVADHLNPKKMLASTTVDIEIVEMEDTGAGASTDQSVYKIIDCRLTRRGASLNKRGILVDSYSFVGILATDSDIADADKVAESGNNDLV